MARFTLTLEVTESDSDSIYDIIDSVASNTGIEDSKIESLVNRYIDGDIITLQFDTDKNRCFILKTNKKGVDDWKKPAPTPQERLERGVQLRIDKIKMLQGHIDEATNAFKAMPDKKCAAATNLLRFIEDTRQELNHLKECMETVSSRSYSLDYAGGDITQTIDAALEADDPLELDDEDYDM